MGLFGRSKNEEQPSESLFEDKIKCDDCGKEYNKSDMRKCKKCGAVICPDCRVTHVCQSKKSFDIQNELSLNIQQEISPKIDDDNVRPHKDKTEKYIAMAEKQLSINNYDKAQKYFLNAAKLGNVNAIEIVAFNKNFIGFLIGERMHYLEYLSQKGDANAMLILSVLYYYVKYKTFDKKIFLYDESCINIEKYYNNNTESFESTGHYFDIYDSDHYSWDATLEEEIYWLTKAHDHGNSKGALRLAVLYMSEPKVKDDDKAIFWANVACSGFLAKKDVFLGDTNLKYTLKTIYLVMWRLGILYYLKDNFKKSAYWITNAIILESNNNIKKYDMYRSSIRSGYDKCPNDTEIAFVQAYLATCYEKGTDGVEQNDEKALIYYQYSAEYRNADAQAALAEFYYGGRGGLPKNEAKVKYWLNLAIEHDNVRALNFLEAHPELKENGVKNINYHADGDIIQGDVGVYAKDDAIVNRANISNDKEDVISNEAVVTSLNQNSEIQEYKFCIYCGAKLPAESRFCMKCGKEV